MPKIKFARDYEPKDGSGKSFKEGEVVEMDDAQARHFVSRGIADEDGKEKGDAPKANPYADQVKAEGIERMKADPGQVAAMQSAPQADGSDPRTEGQKEIGGTAKKKGGPDVVATSADVKKPDAGKQRGK